MHALPLGRHFDRHDPVEHLDPALHLRGLGRLVAEPIDERPHARDFFVLFLLGLPEPFEPRVALDEVLRVRAGVVRDRPERDLGNARDDRVEEKPVVRDEDHGVRIGREVPLEPVPRVEVEMVGRLVEKQQRRAAEQQLGERDAHLPAARKRLGRFREVRLAESEAVEHLRHAQVDAVAFLAPEEIREVVIPDEQRLVFALGERRVGQVVLDAIDLGLGLEQRREGERRLVEQRAAGMVEPVLRQIADGERRGPDDRAAVRLVEAGEHAEQRRLAGAVGTGEPDAFAGGDLPGHLVEQDAFAEGLREGLKLDHDLGSFYDDGNDLRLRRPPRVRQARARRRPTRAPCGTAWSDIRTPRG